ncbi:MAG: hypothetical protein EXR95_09895 [Gemmatimonadetes bacterium]|nr:hypothetical protein [Gemmatimonadota bacterium]
MRPLRDAALRAGLALALGAGACKPAMPETAIDRETFIATYVDLRKTALQSPTRTLTDAQRDSLLAAHGVSEKHLVQFAEVRAADPDYMVALWTEVNALVSPPAPPPPSAPVLDSTAR